MTQKNSSLSVLLPICSMGGYGDIVSAIAMGEYLESKRIPFQISFEDEKAKEKFKLINSNSKWSVYDDDCSKRNKDKNVISICSVGDGRDKKQKKRTDQFLYISEYDSDDRVFNQFNAMFNVKTGFRFDSSEKKYVQSGIYMRNDLQSLLDRIDLAKNSDEELKFVRTEVLDSLTKSISDKYLGAIDNHSTLIKFQKEKERIVASDWSLAYSSSLGTKWSFLDVVAKASFKLDKELYVFVPMNSVDLDSECYFNAKVKQYPFSFFDFNELSLIKRDSPVTILKFDNIPDYLFKQITACTSSLSLVTGDHSLSQMMQKGLSKSPTPFFYQMPNWKQRLGYNLHLHMKKTSAHAAELFGGYINMQNQDVCSPGYLGSYMHLFNNFSTDQNEMAKLFYQKNAIADYNNAIVNIKNSFIEQRKDVGIKKARLLWSVQDTVGYIVKGLLNGAEEKELLSPLLPKQK
ncbi:MAG: hypothetical protein ABIC91_03610 [Nanoarchaeota archaeon]|nr:hypothetical protein [Nanoarchaeota archaeon]MBU1031177.1 hypothetical protein [Nanoarchaeota archaeon]MBU1849676.1 hypothetical protein [Nanoarchaeota archaeon]